MATSAKSQPFRRLQCQRRSQSEAKYHVEYAKVRWWTGKMRPFCVRASVVSGSTEDVRASRHLVTRNCRTAKSLLLVYPASIYSL